MSLIPLFSKLPSERKMAELLGISRSHLRSIHEGVTSPSLKTLARLAQLQNRELKWSFNSTSQPKSEDSLLWCSHLILKDGVDSWKIHLMNFVDSFRSLKDERLIDLPPLKKLDPKISALLASTVLFICEEFQMNLPPWALLTPALKKPWFVSGSEALKIFALIESPLVFRMKNIFVLRNFLERV